MDSIIGRIERWGAGLFLDITKSDASQTGFLQFGNLASFEIGKDGGSTEKFKSTNPLGFGSVIGSLVEPGDDTVNVTINTLHRQLWGVSALGDDAVVTVAAGSAVDQAITAKLDAWVNLPHRFITSTTDVVTGSGGTPTYVRGTDYDIDLTWGRIRAKSGGSISEGASLLVDYDHQGESGYEITASQQGQITAEMYLLGQDQRSKDIGIFHAKQTQWSPRELITLVTTDANKIAEVSLTASIELATGEAAPYTWRVVGKAA